MPLSESNIADLVTSLLTVNMYPLEKAVGLMPAFKERGLLDPAKVAAMGQEALIVAMNDAGYTRGGFVPIIAYRLYPLMDAIAAGQLDGLIDASEKGDRDRFILVLGAIHGFGPRTGDTVWRLWTGD